MMEQYFKVVALYVPNTIMCHYRAIDVCEGQQRSKQLHKCAKLHVTSSVHCILLGLNAHFTASKYDIDAF